MLRSLFSRFRTSRWVSLVCIVSLCTNIFFIISSRHVNKVVYRRQDLVKFRIEEGSMSIDDFYNHVTPAVNAIQDQGNVRPSTDTSSTENKQLTLGDDTSRSGRVLQEENHTRCTLCPLDPPNLLGPLADMTQEMTAGKLSSIFPELKRGRFRPTDCQARQRLAIIIPYRNRYPHLHIFLHNLIPFLFRQQADATIFVIEQAPPEIFNRGALLNVGYLEAEKSGEFDCFIFHDVDLIPLDDRHMYRCGDNPRHFAVAMNKYKFRMPYRDYFGGAVGFSKRQYLDINGCSNVYFGWGGEDDEMKERVENRRYSIVRSPVHIARYDMIKHTRDKGNEANPVRKRILASARRRQDLEGLNTIKYKVNSINYHQLYIWINVSLNQTEILESAPPYVAQAMLEAQRIKAVTPQHVRKVKPAHGVGNKVESTLTTHEVDSNIPGKEATNFTQNALKS